MLDEHVAWTESESPVATEASAAPKEPDTIDKPSSDH